MSSARAGDAESDVYAWVQYGADGRAHLRVIPSDRAACPAATADGFGVTLGLAIYAAAGFDRALCEAVLPLGARTVRVGTLALPPLPRRVARFVVLGRHGVPDRAAVIQNCRDGLAWPFARIARSIASEQPRPDLIVHVGDYVGRDAPCPAGDPRCAGSPAGDDWSAWSVDLFEPGAALFATAPIIWLRGDHEGCTRAAIGWSRYLAPMADSGCRAHDDPVLITFANVRFVDIDSSAAIDDIADPSFARDERVAGGDASGLETVLLTHRPPLPAPDPAGVDLAAIIAGQSRLFAALSFPAAPPTVIVGTGGGALAVTEAARLAATVDVTAEARFGYAVFDEIPGGWSISERDPDGAEHRRCELRARTVHC